jgi:hypothetical protein
MAHRTCTTQAFSVLASNVVNLAPALHSMRHKEATAFLFMDIPAVAVLLQLL